MRRTLLPLATSALALIAAGPALADLTAEDVWNSWLSIAEAQGQTVTVGGTSRDAETLTQSGVTMTMVMSEGRVEMTLDEVVFTEEFGGSVAIGLPDSYDVEAEFEDDEGQTVGFTLVVSHPGLSISASGDPDAISYAYAGETATMAMTGISVNGETQNIDISGTVSGFSGESNVTAGALQMTESTFTAAELTATGQGVVPDDPATGVEGGAFDFDFSMVDVASQSQGAMPSDPAQFMAALADGAAMDFSVTHGGSSLSFDSTVDGQPVQTTQTNASGALSFAINSESLSFEATGLDSEVQMAGMAPMMPPVSYTLESSSALLSLPVSPSDEPRDFSLSLRLEGLAVNEGLWSMFDPAGALPRDPATVIVDVSGSGQWFVNVFDPETIEQMETAPMIPGQVNSVQVNEIRIALAGAMATLSGAFDIDNSQMPPVPVGAADLNIAGLNGLIDTLISIGLVPEEQAMGARMFMGMFAVPGDGPDTLKSEIETTADGAVIVNGQRVK